MGVPSYDFSIMGPPNPTLIMKAPILTRPICLSVASKMLSRCALSLRSTTSRGGSLTQLMVQGAEGLGAFRAQGFGFSGFWGGRVRA